MDSIDVGIEDTPAPDGGWRAWACVASSFSVMFCVFGFGMLVGRGQADQAVTSLGELQTYYTHNQLASYSEAEIACVIVSFTDSDPQMDSCISSVSHRCRLAVHRSIL